MALNSSTTVSAGGVPWRTPTASPLEPTVKRYRGAGESPWRRRRESGKPDRGTHPRLARVCRPALMPLSIAKTGSRWIPTPWRTMSTLDDAVVSVVPTHGAIVRANFNAQVGMKIPMTLTHRGKPVLRLAPSPPATATRAGSIVADNGQVVPERDAAGGQSAGEMGGWPGRSVRGRLPSAAGEPAAGAQSAFGRVPLRRS